MGAHQHGIRVVGHGLHDVVDDLIESARDVVREEVVREEVLRRPNTELSAIALSASAQRSEKWREAHRGALGAVATVAAAACKKEKDSDGSAAEGATCMRIDTRGPHRVHVRHHGRRRGHGRRHGPRPCPPHRGPAWRCRSLHTQAGRGQLWQRPTTGKIGRPSSAGSGKRVAFCRNRQTPACGRAQWSGRRRARTLLAIAGSTAAA